MNVENQLASKYSEAEIKACVSLLEDLVQNTAEFAGLSKELKIALIKVAGQLSRPDRDMIRL